MSRRHEQKKASIPPITDSLSSLSTSLGEKFAEVNYLRSRSRLSDNELIKAYRNSWLVGQYIDKTVDDMLKKPREFDEKIDKKLLEPIFETEKRTGVPEAIRSAIMWTKLLGDALIVAVTNIDTSDYETPLQSDETILKFITLSKREFTPSKIKDDDITSLTYGEPASYQLKVGKGLVVHASRCLRLKNGICMLSDSHQFGISDIQPAYDAIKSFDLAMTCIADLLQDSNVDVLTVPDLLQKLATPNGSEMVTTYAYEMKRIKSSSGIILIDAGYDGKTSSYDQKQVNFSGLSEVISKLAIVVGGALNRPLKILFGESAKGFSTGEEDNTAYYETIHGEQEHILRKTHDFIDKFILNKMLEEKIPYEFPSIDMPNASEESTTFSTYSTGIASLVSNDVMTPEQALRELKSLGVLSTITDEDIDDLKDSTIGFDYGANPIT